MPRICQVVALEAGTRNRAYAELTELYKNVQQSKLTTGLSRTYQPLREGDETLPVEHTRVQVSADRVIAQASAALTKLWDITATRDWANCQATGTVRAGDTVLLQDAPVVYLLFLAKQLSDLRAVISKLPVHDPADRWVWDPSADCYRTDPPVETYRTRKVPRNHVKADPTDRHPAQVEVYFEDIQVGRWTAVKFSGGVPAERRAELLDRVDRLAVAVSNAREEANAARVDDVQVAAPILAWLFSGEVGSAASAS
jgi:hypothetical protein